MGFCDALCMAEAVADAIVRSGKAFQVDPVTLANQLLTELLETGDHSGRRDTFVFDPTYVETPFDREQKGQHPEYFGEGGQAKRGLYLQRDFCSRRFLTVMNRLLDDGFLIYAHPVWDKNGHAGFLCRLSDRGSLLLRRRREIDRIYPVADPNAAFVIMSLSGGSELQDFYRFGIKEAVEGLGFSCTRIDEAEYNYRIAEEILRRIEACRFVVADLTDARPNCYYELGYAHRAKKDVIHTCHKDSLLHLDVRDYNFIIYQSAFELRDRLVRRIKQSIGKPKRRRIPRRQVKQDT